MKRPIYLIWFALALTILTACTPAGSEETQTVEVISEVTRLVQATVEVEVTRLVEVTRIVPEIMTVVVFPTAAPPTPTDETTPTPESTETATPAPTTASARTYTSGDVLAAFQAAGLEVGTVSPLVVEPGAPLPQSYVEASRFLIPSIGEGNGGRVFSFANIRERDMVYEYYLHLPLPGLSTWVSANSLLVLQINDALPRDRWLEYEAVFQGLK